MQKKIFALSESANTFHCVKVKQRDLTFLCRIMLWAIHMSLKGQSQENRRSWEMSEEFITINSKCNWKNSNKCKFFKKLGLCHLILL